jgi:hypothetical protein
MQLSIVVYACNPSYLGSQYQEDHGLRPAQAKSYQDPISISKSGVVVHACDPSYVGGHRKENHSLRSAPE